MINQIRMEEFLSVPNAAKELGKPKMTLYRWIKKNLVASLVVGRTVFIPKNEVQRLKEEIKNKEADAVRTSA